MTDMDSLIEIMARAIFANDLSWHGMLEKNRERFRNQARACLTALSEAGWCVVPKVPTVAMENAGVSAAGQQGYIAANEGETNAIWSAMVAAGRGET